VALPLSLADASDAKAQGRLDARYTVSLAGIPVGRGAWVIDVTDDHYRAAATGTTVGLLRVFASGHGSSAAQGVISPTGQVIPASFASTVTAEKQTEDIRITQANGSVKDFTVEPPSPPAPDRIPLTEAHRIGAFDPMSASIIRVTGNGDPLSPMACQRTMSIFDGRMRYDLRLSFKRMDRVKAEKGYEGPVVVCAVHFNPLAGHIPDRAAIKYLIEQQNIEAWFAPLAGTRMLVPFRVSVPTPIGTGVLEATQFVSAAQVRPTASRTQ
jgi:hypothetical protein